MKKYDLHTVVIDGSSYSYFYTRERNDMNGNARYRVRIIDPGAHAVYEKIIKCYESLILEYIKNFIEDMEV